MKKSMTNHKTFSYTGFLLYALSFLIAAIGMLLILKSRGFYPFKDNTLLTADMREQYVNFYASLRYLFTGDDSIFFSWSRTMGGNYLGLFAYYLSSPFTWITLLFPVEKIYIAVTVMTVLKIAMCGCTFSIFASYIWKKYCPQCNPRYLFILLPIAVSYALTSYNIAYCVCLMWLDGVILLPLILLGVEKLLEGRKGMLYFLTLTSLFFCNYYTGYMAGLFTAVYLLFRLMVLIHKSNWKQYALRTFRFAAITLLSIGVAMPLLLPVIKELSQGRLTSYIDNPLTLSSAPLRTSFDIFINGFFDGLSYDASPHIYCGYLGISLAFIFFLLRRISLREKLAAAIVFLFLFASLYFVPLNMAWHGFVNPMWFPYRHTFVFGFFLLYLAVRALCALPLDKLPCLSQRKPVFEAVVVAALLATALDMGTNGRSIFFGIEDRYDYATISDYQSFLSGTKPLVTDIHNRDNGFYRINEGYSFSKNDSMLLGFNGMTHYSSTYNPKVLDFLSRLGFSQEFFWNTGYGSTPLTDSLFSVKYILEDNPVPSFYSALQENSEENASYINDYALSVVYSAPLANSSPDLSSHNPFVNQNTLLNSIAGTDYNYFTPLEYTTEGSDVNRSYSFTADSHNPVYLYMKSFDYSATDVLVNGEPVGEYFLAESKCILYLGSFAPGQSVVVDILPSASIDISFATIEQLHLDLLKNTLQMLQENSMQISGHHSGSLQGTITVPENQKLVTSIPYDEGWTVKIDGQKVPIQQYADTFILIDAESGEHALSLYYVSPGLGTGIFICVIALVLAILYFKRSVKK